EVFARRGDSVLVVRGEDGLDEFATTAPTRIWAVRDGMVSEAVLDAVDLGLPRVSREALLGGDAGHNAEVDRRLLDGATGPVRDSVLLNAATGIVAREGWGSDLAGALSAAMPRAAESIDSGAAADTLQRWITVAKAAATA